MVNLNLDNVFKYTLFFWTSPLTLYLQVQFLFWDTWYMILYNNCSMEMEQGSMKGIQIKDILMVTGTFDVATFNKKFEEDTLRERSVQSYSRAEMVLEEEEDDPVVESVPVNEKSLDKLLRTRRKINQPISSWFLKQLLLMTDKNNDGE